VQSEQLLSVVFGGLDDSALQCTRLRAPPVVDPGLVGRQASATGPVAETLHGFGRRDGHGNDVPGGLGTFHDLWRTCITNWAKHLPIHVVQQLAGHGDINTTRKYYLSVQVDDLEKARQVQLQILADNPTDQEMTNSAGKTPVSGRQPRRPAMHLTDLTALMPDGPSRIRTLDQGIMSPRRVLQGPTEKALTTRFSGRTESSKWLTSH